MGLFDTIRDRLFCPFCGKLQKEDSFQTKDLGKNMGDFTLEEIRKFKTGLRQKTIIYFLSLKTILSLCDKHGKHPIAHSLLSSSF